MTRLLVFKLIFVVITVTLLLFQVVIWKKISPRVLAWRFGKSFRALYIAMVLAGQSVLWVGIFYPGRGMATSFPEWYEPIHRVVLAINYSHFFWVLPLGVLWLIGLVLKRTSLFAPDLHQGQKENAISRADFFKRAAGAAAFGVNLVPAATTVGAISGMFLGSREIWVNEKQVKLNQLHDDLKGLRIVQISDIHIGNLIGEKYLNFTLGLIRAAKPDYVFVTGDIIDNNNAFLPTAGTFFALMNSMLPGRVFGVLGNHDYIDDGRAAAKGFSEAGLRILLNEVVTLKRGKGQLQLGGLDYPRLGQSRPAAMQNYFASLKPALKPETPLVLLNHHPSDFEYLKYQKVDLVLSGHTHGGQINFSSNRNSFLNGASWGYKYYVDLYEEQGSQLYVNRGLGHWFPLRITCPPEVTVFTLV
ncbi:MAG: metallophosphoesterase [Turneriella sp.]